MKNRIRSNNNKRASEPKQQDLPAGDFSSWLSHARKALFDGSGTDVHCGDCTGCCTSSYFIHVKADERTALGRIRKEVLFPAPGQPRGHVLMGYDKNGLCPMLAKDKCSIYEHRPQTCRNYDCRIFTAAGIAAGGQDKAAINHRVNRWKFSYPTKLDQDEHLAVKAAAEFIEEHPDCFPGGKVPGNPSQLAVVAIKAYEIFLKKEGEAGKPGRDSSDAGIANAIVQACREFDAKTQPED